MNLYTANEMREMDRAAIEGLGMPGAVLMENAARGAAKAIRRAVGSVAARRVLIVCGKGNNGGDGFAVARLLRDEDADVQIILLAGAGELKGDAAVNCAVCKNLKIPIRECKSVKSLARIEEEAQQADIIVDAMLGTGARGNLSPLVEGAIAAINRSGAFVCGIDAPSGIAADTGGMLGGEAVRCDVTAAFGGLKIGLFAYPAANCAGKICLVDIGIPGGVMSSAKGVAGSLIGPGDIAPFLIPRPKDAHKGFFGRLLIIGGSRGMPGAPAMAAAAVLRMGAGLVYAAVPEGIQALAHQHDAEIISHGLAETGSGALSVQAESRLVELQAGVDAVILGPGMSTDVEAVGLARRAISKIDRPLIVDADGLNALAGKPGALKAARGPVVATPHIGEIARLLGRLNEEIAASRLAAALELAKRENAVVLLKGPGTIVAAPDGRFKINVTGNPGMATAGSGDVLCGMIGSLLAQGAPAFEAAAAAAYLHGLAGDLAASCIGQTPLVATDITAAIPEALSAVQKGQGPLGFERFGLLD